MSNSGLARLLGLACCRGSMRRKTTSLAVLPVIRYKAGICKNLYEMHTKKYLKKHENKNALDRIEFESECFLKNSAFICFS